MCLLRFYLRLHAGRFAGRGVRFHFLGDLGGMPDGIRADALALEEATRGGGRMAFHLAANYGSRMELARAARACVEDGLGAAEVDEAALQARLWTAGVPDVDLLIRTSGEQRVSNFLLWQCAYAELYFADCHWPDFGGDRFREALEAFAARDRRFGGAGG
jgi:undecaprenyl diphosphate synthase